MQFKLTGDFGGIRAGTIVQPFLSELGIISLPVRVTLPTVHTKFDDDEQPNDTRFKESVERMVKELVWYAEALSTQKMTSNEIPK